MWPPPRSRAGPAKRATSAISAIIESLCPVGGANAILRCGNGRSMCDETRTAFCAHCRIFIARRAGSCWSPRDVSTALEVADLAFKEFASTQHPTIGDNNA
jgi:hypothetical protein